MKKGDAVGVEVAPCIVVYEDVFDATIFLRTLIQECEEEEGFLNWTRDTVGDGEVTDKRTSMSCSIDNLREAEEYSETLNDNTKLLIDEWMQIFPKIDDVVWSYRSSYDLPLHGDQGYRVLRYRGGEEYQAHHDHGPDNNRVLSLVGFVNDGYTGGELVFPTFDVTITPKAGSIVAFPSNFPYKHIAKPVGEDGPPKYSLVSWFE